MENHSAKKRFATISAVAMLVAVALIGGIFYWLYHSAKQNIVSMWWNRTLQIAQDVGYYLTTPMDAVAFTAMKVNGMLENGTPNEEIAKYLINESEIYARIIEGNETGIYGYCRDEYLDGSGWVPPKEYVPTSRPWYGAALAANGETAFVKPYRNLQTFNMMMSVSQLLNDKRSVVSMDIFLGNVQQMVEDIVAKNDIDLAMVIDREGAVVAHSDADEVGKEYGDDSSPFGKHLVEHLAVRGEPIFEIGDGTKEYMAFAEPVNEYWYVVLLLDENKMFRSLQRIYILSALTLIVVLGAIFLGFLFMNRKHAEAERLGREIKAVADIYVAMAIIDLKTDCIRPLRMNEALDRLLGGNLTNYSKRVLGLTEILSSDQSRQLMLNFMDPATLEERLTGLNTISHEFLDNRNCWIRVKFIVVDRDANARLHRVLLAFESIDEDRKQQERLRELSEKDMMTGIRNRGSGEAMVRKKMSDGVKGMFCLLDADKFKSVNDIYGHAVGDKVIIAIAACLTKTFRDTDVVFRLGGDEFAVYAEGVNDQEIGNRIIERLFQNITEIEIPELEERRICISVGGTFYPADRNDSFEALYDRADSGLYESKRVSGNHVTFHAQEGTA